MNILWAKGAGTVSDVAQAIPAHAPLAYSSILTTLRILETKGYLTHIKQGRAFIYKPAIAQEEARETAVSHLLRRFFGDSPEQLVLNLVGGGKISPEELERLRALVAKKKATVKK